MHDVVALVSILAGTAQAFGLVYIAPTPSFQRVPWHSRVVPSLSHQRAVALQQQHQQRRRQGRRRVRRVLCMSGSSDDVNDEDEMDWREMRAKLIAQEKKVDSSSSSESSTSSTGSDSDGSTSSFAYETPLIEQGSILLGGTKMEFGFALRQQFFHKSVMLLLQHDETFTKGIILNRPSALEVDGWRAWCGHGQVAEGGLFVGDDRKMGTLEINALHSLTSNEADEVSTRVIKGVSYTTLEAATDLVAGGAANKTDFWVCVGFSGWAPGQLQNELEQRDSWYLASADSGTLLAELSREARQLTLTPPGDADVTVDSGIDTWSNLMRAIGREKDVLSSMNTLEDRMLQQWVRVHLMPKPKITPPDAPPPGLETGMVIATTVSPETGRPADRFLMHDQHLHKALLLVLDASAPSGKISVCVLNRPTAGLFRFNLPGSPQRRVPFCGDLALASELWLHYSDLGGVALGDSGVSVLSTAEMSDKINARQATMSDFLLVRGVVQFGRPEIAGMLAKGEMRCITPGSRLSGLWPRVWGLTDWDEEKGTAISDGTEMWWLASQCSGDSGAEGEQKIMAPVPSDLADEALAEWLKWYAGHQS